MPTDNINFDYYCYFLLRTIVLCIGVSYICRHMKNHVIVKLAFINANYDLSIDAITQ